MSPEDVLKQILLIYIYKINKFTGTMVPIPKGNRLLLTCSDNYRAIPLSSVVGKVYDWVGLIKEHCALSCSHLQFGFKEHVSSTQCTFVMSEIMSYYNAS